MYDRLKKSGRWRWSHLLRIVAVLVTFGIVAGSIASNASNRGSGRPKKGIRMAGQYGATPVTSRNLRVVRIDAENNLILVEGAVPGPNGGLITIRPTTKKKTTHGKVKTAAPVSKAKAAAAAKKK